MDWFSRKTVKQFMYLFKCIMTVIKNSPWHFITQHLRRFPENCQRPKIDLSLQWPWCALYMTLWLQCNAWPLASLCSSGYCLCISTLSEAECAPETDALKALMLFLWCVSQSLQKCSALHCSAITVCMKLSCTLHFFGVDEKEEKWTKTHGGAGYRTTF